MKTIEYWLCRPSEQFNKRHSTQNRKNENS